MQLDLDRSDLERKHINTRTSLVKFEHLNEKAQAAVRAVGKGTFWQDRGHQNETYNVVHAP